MEIEGDSTLVKDIDDPNNITQLSCPSQMHTHNISERKNDVFNTHNFNTHDKFVSIGNESNSQFPDFSGNYNFKLKPIKDLNFENIQVHKMDNIQNLFFAIKDLFVQTNNNQKTNNDNLQHVYSTLESHNTRINNNILEIPVKKII